MVAFSGSRISLTFEFHNNRKQFILIEFLFLAFQTQDLQTHFLYMFTVGITNVKLISNVGFSAKIGIDFQSLSNSSLVHIC